MTRTLLAPSDMSRARPSILSSKRAGRRVAWTEPHVQRQQQQIRLRRETNSGFLLIRLPIEFVASRLGLAPLLPTPSATVSTPPPTSLALVAHEPSTTPAMSTTSTTPTSIAPAPVSTPPIPPPRFRERDETNVRPLVADLRLLDL
jgi:hypothetical protein